MIVISSDEEDDSPPPRTFRSRVVVREDSVISLTDSEDEVKQGKRSPSIIYVSDGELSSSSNKENTGREGQDVSVRTIQDSALRLSYPVVIYKDGTMSREAIIAQPPFEGTTKIDDPKATTKVEHEVEDQDFELWDAMFESDGPADSSPPPPLIHSVDHHFPGVFSYEVYPAVQNTDADGRLCDFNINARWMFKVVIWFHVSVGFFSDMHKGLLLTTTQKDFEPVHKMITLEQPSGTLNLNNYFITRRIFQRVRCEEFRIWDSQTADWKAGRPSDPIPFSIRENHTALIRLPLVTRLTAFPELLLQAQGKCTTVDYSCYFALDPKGKKPALE